jgi:hypothetical protein
MTQSSPSRPANILLCTLNARYSHASLGLRYLQANMGALRAHTQLLELTINRPTEELLQALLDRLGPLQAEQRCILGLGVYIWNVQETLALVLALRTLRPDVVVVVGGPEVSHEVHDQAIVRAADHVITGWGDISFAQLCQALIYGPQPLMHIITGIQPPLDELVLPYQGYTDEDIAHRLIYVEASRGCPFKCEFCLSSLDKTAWSFDQDRFLAEIGHLVTRGVRQFKFVDRTFNLKIEASARILQFFLDQIAAYPGDSFFVHFELVPDQLPERLKALMVQFPAGALQFEIGIQTFNPDVQQRISRRQDNAKTETHLAWLVEHTHAHLHTDLIFGLPGESLVSFAEGFDRLWALGPHEIQLGILKRLRGTPIHRHTEPWGMVYDTSAPYTVQQTSAVTAAEVQGMTRMARYWDLLANSGRYQASMARVMGLPGLSPFWRFWDLSNALYQSTGKTHGLSPEALIDFLFHYLSDRATSLPAPGSDALTLTQEVRQLLLEDYLRSGAKAKPAALADLLTRRQRKHRPNPKAASVVGKRQQQHLDGTPST